MEDITQQVCETLAKYWPNMTVYRENQPDGFVTPSFFVHRISLGSTRSRMQYQWRTYAFEVDYFPDDSDDGVHAYSELDNMAEQMADSLTMLGDALAHIEQLDVTVEREQLVVQATFNVTIHAAPVLNPTLQGKLDYQGGIANGERTGNNAKA
ncbi:phage tail terminator family protein [Lacticaseibacillus hulanensis]|uniref:phage tail terminator family protein n=1 Tax=Lacticaseibacillus hulanensis TaxID=2493111 RepID=UPI000FD8D0F7|nr:hypothetical protein [Lacticaseibacillus hulanensis]